MKLFNNKFNIKENGDFEAVGSFHATKSIQVHDGFEILEEGTEDTVFHIYIGGTSGKPVIPPSFNNTMVFRTEKLDNVNKMQYTFWNSALSRPTFVLNQGAPNRATVIERSLIVGAEKGTKALDENYTDGNSFTNLAFDTTLNGADFGVENDCEILGKLFVDEIKESTQDAGVKINNSFAVIDGEIYMYNLAGQGNKPVQVDNDGRLYTIPQ